MPARKLAQMLVDTPALQAIGEASRHVEHLQRIYLEVAPAELSGSSRVGWARGGVLFIATGNGATAAKLRQLAPRILDHFRRQGLEFNSMRIDVQVGARPAESPRSQRNLLSEKALQAIRAARDQTAPSPLKAALARLGRTR